MLNLKGRGGKGGGGAFSEVLQGEAPLCGRTPHPYMNYFWQKRYSFQLINGTPASFANCCKCTICLYVNKKLNQEVFLSLS